MSRVENIKKTPTNISSEVLSYYKYFNSKHKKPFSFQGNNHKCSLNIDKHETNVGK